MKCTKCNGEWTPPPGKSLTACPFCGASLQAEPVGADSGNVIAEIVRRFGDGTLLDPQKLRGLIGDLIPGEPATRKRLRLAIHEKVPQKLHGLKNKDEHERDRVMRIEASGLSEMYAMAVEEAYKIVNYFAAALGYKTIMVASPQVPSTPSVPPKPSVPPMPVNRPDVLIDNIVGIEMILVRGGTFRMGDTDGQGGDNEKPVHNVTLRDFYIGKYPVTQKQWVQVMGSNHSNFKGDDLPVEQVSWNNVQEIIKELNAKTGKKYRLPTEAEWEYAARGGNKSKGYKYSGSNDIDKVAWYADNSGNKTHPVGTKAPNELGIYDMSGNVWEWVNDKYGGKYWVCLKKSVNCRQGVKIKSYWQHIPRGLCCLPNVI
jgi:formylglycine-generating enzyme required for sulfatase activity